MADLNKQAENQAIYMQRLADKALEMAKAQENPLFDPQGRMLVAVTLDEQEKNDVLAPMGGEVKSLKDALGRETVSETTLVSLDIASHPDLKQQYEATLSGVLKDNNAPEYSTQYIEALRKIKTGSIIPLQQEFHFHLSLAARTYQAIGVDNNKVSTALTATEMAVNKLVMQEFAKALIKATHSSTLDIKQLNKELDNARGTIMPQAHALFKKQLAKNQVSLQADSFKDIKHIAETTTASGDDVLHLDAELGLATLITGSEITAHDRAKGKTADRQLITHQLDNNDVSANANPRIQVRTPSLDVKEGLDASETVLDISNKFESIARKYNFAETLPNNEENAQPKAFIYNLYTSLNDNAGDLKGNLQTQGARYILQGMHHYNASQQIEENGVFCFVQNIPVNGFGDSLSYNGRNAVVKEATLMTDMALLHTLYEVSDDKNKETINNVVEGYKAYLASKPRSDYFFQSQQGKDAIKSIKTIKNQWRQQATPEPNLSNDKKAKNALQKMVAFDLHHSHDYAKLTQALCVYVEKASIGGCKSSNERAQAINGRVAILDTGNQAIFKAIDDLLVDDIQSQASVKVKAKALKQSLDNVYNQQGLQGGASLVSLLDQGAAAKVEAKPNKLLYFSRNYAEEKTLTNLQQSKASKMQAHKSLTKEMQKAWDKPKNSPADSNENDADNELTKSQDEIDKIDAAKETLLDKISKSSTAYPVGKDQMDLLNDKAKNELFDGIDQYKEERAQKLGKDNAEDPAHYRKAFISLLYDKAKTMPKGEGKPLTLEEMLGKKGVKLYKNALEEERYSKEFMTAVFNRSTKHYEGEKWAKRLIVPIGGPSGAGKSYASASIIEQAGHFMPKISGNVSGNDVVAVDGGIGRELSMMRNEVIKIARLNSHAGVSDLHGKSKVLGKTKECVNKAALKMPGLNIAWPETFSGLVSRKTSKQLTHYMQLKSAQVIFSRVISPDNNEQMRKVIKYNGQKRAYGNTDNPAENLSYDKFDYSKLPESKAYDSGVKKFNEKFWAGLKGSTIAENLFKKFKRRPVVVHVVNDMILLKCTGDNHWEQTNRASEATRSISERIFKAWQGQSEIQDLDEFMKDQGKQYGPLIQLPEIVEFRKDVEHFADKAKDDPIAQHISVTINDSLGKMENHLQKGEMEQYTKTARNLGRMIQFCNESREHLKLPKSDKSFKTFMSKIHDVVRVTTSDERQLLNGKGVQNNNFFREADFYWQKQDALGFTTEVKNADKIEEGIEAKTSDASGLLEIKSEEQVPVSFANKTLGQNEVLRAYTDFSTTPDVKKHGLLKQDHTGKVTDLSSANLESSEKSQVAFKQAHMLLMHWKPDGGAITIRGRDSDMANKVYASLLLLKNSDPKFKSTTIVSFVSGCNGPKSGKRSQTKFINEHLGKPENSPINHDMRARAISELKESSSARFRTQLTQMREDDQGLVEKKEQQPDMHTRPK